MSQAGYVIHYKDIPSVERSTRRTMESYLDQEMAAWQPFLDHLSATPELLQFHSGNRATSIVDLATTLRQLRSLLDDPARFAAATVNNFRRLLSPPPPSGTVEGRLVMGLYAAGRPNDAIAAYAGFISREMGSALRFEGGQKDGSNLLALGEMLLAAAHASASVSSQRSGAGTRTLRMDAERLLASLDAQVGEANAINHGHAARLTQMRDDLAVSAIRLRGLFVRTERRRARRHLEWRAGIEGEVAERFADAEARLQALERLSRDQHEAREQAFEDLKSLFHVQLRLRAPVALWQARSETHQTRAVAAQRLFWIATLFAIAVGIGVPYVFGDYIAGSFHSVECATTAARACTRQFSAKGPLTVGGLLLTSSLILWAIRMQYRIFLSERHLSLDADEKKAFAETFMALKEGATVDTANETIVLASLFRPTQDGIIKDEPGSFDLSAAAMLAKQIAK